MDDREGFEKWASDDGAWPKAIERNGEDYKLMQTQLFWCGWKAACKFRDEPKVESVPTCCKNETLQRITPHEAGFSSFCIFFKVVCHFPLIT